MVKVAFFKGRHPSIIDNIGSDLVRWWTNGPYSHVEIITKTNDQGQSYTLSAVLKANAVRGVWQTLVDSDWDFVELDIDPAVVESWFDDKIKQGCKYDLLGLIGFVLRRNQYSKNKYFCSETVADSVGVAEGWRYDPNALKPIIDKLSTYNKGT
jgi:hypothetical protein